MVFLLVLVLESTLTGGHGLKARRQRQIAWHLFFSQLFSWLIFLCIFQFSGDFGSPRAPQNPLKSTRNPKKSHFGASIFRFSISASIFHHFSLDFHEFLHQFLDVNLNKISNVFGMEIPLGIYIFCAFPEKRETWKSSVLYTNNIVFWHVALCNNSLHSKTRCRKTYRKTHRKKHRKLMKK